MMQDRSAPIREGEARAGGSGPGGLAVGRPDVERASGRIAAWIRLTPVLEVEPETFGTPGSVTLKLECHQHTGSFKPRGAFNRILSNEVPDAGVIAASGGNFGLAVAYAASRLGHRAEVFVPESTPEVKVHRLRADGANVSITGATFMRRRSKPPKCDAPIAVPCGCTPSINQRWSPATGP